jgi:hypothetical protein
MHRVRSRESSLQLGFASELCNAAVAVELSKTQYEGLRNRRLCLSDSLIWELVVGGLQKTCKGCEETYGPAVLAVRSSEIDYVIKSQIR